MRKVVVLVLAFGCGSVTAKSDAPLHGSDAAGDSSGTVDAPPGPCSKPFGAPQAVGGLPYTASDNIYGVSLSPDELTIYFSNYGVGNGDMFVATRSSKVNAFGAPTPLTNLSGTNFKESDPTVTGDGLTMFLDDGGVGDENIYMTTRTSVTGSFAAPTVVPGINSTTFDDAPYITPDGVHLYFASYRDNNLYDIYTATRSNGTFGAVTRLTELSSAQNGHPVVTQDQLTMYIDRGSDIYVTHRATTSDPWGAPVAVSELNTAKAEFPAWISADCSTLYFTTNRDADLLKVWAATRMP